MARNAEAEPEPAVENSPKLDCLRRSRRNQRSEFYAEMLDLREAGLSPQRIAPRIGMNVRTVERWLAAGGEPEHRRPPSHSVLMDPFRDYLEKRWEEGHHNELQLWTEIKQRGFQGSRATVYRWTAARKERSLRSSTVPLNLRWRPPSRRNCAWFLCEDPQSLDEQTRRFLHHLHEKCAGAFGRG